MLKNLKNFLKSNNSEDNQDANYHLNLLCGLMIEAANTDGNIDSNEIKKINSLLINTFKESPANVEKVLNQCLENRNNSKSLFYYTSKINKEYDEKKKLLLIETIWEVVLSDGLVHDYESSLIRRLSGLLYISDVSSGNAKEKALNNIRKNK